MVVACIENAAEKPLYPLPGYPGFDINELATVDAENEDPITAGFFKLEPKTSQVKYGPYSYSQAGIVLEGHVKISNEDDSIVEAKKGDLLTLKKGETETWTSEEGAHFFYVALRVKGSG